MPPGIASAARLKGRAWVRPYNFPKFAREAFAKKRHFSLFRSLAFSLSAASSFFSSSCRTFTSSFLFSKMSRSWTRAKCVERSLLKQHWSELALQVSLTPPKQNRPSRRGICTRVGQGLPNPLLPTVSQECSGQTKVVVCWLEYGGSV